MELLTVKETAALLRVSQITIRRYIASGELPAVRVGRGIRVQRDDVEEFLEPVVPNGMPNSPDAIMTWRDDDDVAVEPKTQASDDVGADPGESLDKPFTFDDPL